MTITRARVAGGAGRKLLGAVTDVLINNPALRYGIFIENMLETAG